MHGAPVAILDKPMKEFKKALDAERRAAGYITFDEARRLSGLSLRTLGVLAASEEIVTLPGSAQKWASIESLAQRIQRSSPERSQAFLAQVAASGVRDGPLPRQEGRGRPKGPGRPLDPADPAERLLARLTMGEGAPLSWRRNGRPGGEATATQALRIIREALGEPHEALGEPVRGAAAEVGEVALEAAPAPEEATPTVYDFSLANRLFPKAQTPRS